MYLHELYVKLLSIEFFIIDDNKYKKYEVKGFEEKSHFTVQVLNISAMQNNINNFL